MCDILNPQTALGKPQKKFLFFSGQSTKRGGGKGLSSKEKDFKRNNNNL